MPQILKLSYNKLREISSSLTFSGLTSLLRLYLDHNLLQHIHPRALLQLPSLRLLRLQGNRLHQLHPHSLCTLSLLNTYYFSTLRWALLLEAQNIMTIVREMSDHLKVNIEAGACWCFFQWNVLCVVYEVWDWPFFLFYWKIGTLLILKYWKSKRSTAHLNSVDICKNKK